MAGNVSYLCFSYINLSKILMKENVEEYLIWINIKHLKKVDRMKIVSDRK